MKQLPLASQVLESTRQVTVALRRPDHEKVVHLIQGFVAGALFVTVVNLSRQILFGKGADQRSVAWATAILAALVYSWIVASIDRNEKEPWQMLLMAFFWGTVVSGTIAGLLNTIWKVYIGPNLINRGLIEQLFSIAPYTEELTKGAILFLIFWYFYDEFDGALDGIVYGAMVGIGFALNENAGYFFNRDPAATIVEQMHTGQFFLRVVLKGLAGHATYTAMTGLGLGLAKETQRRWLKIMLPILGLVMAILAHAMWNSHWVHDRLDLASKIAEVALINGPFFVAVVIAVLLSWRKEARVITQYLENELDPNDPYTSPAMMYSVANRFRSRWRIMWKRSISKWWNLKQLQYTWIELAFCKWRGREETSLRQRIKLLRSQLES